MDMDSRLLKRLSEVVAAYGANPARWPKGERSRLEEAARENPRMLAEAHEIDRVLDQLVERLKDADVVVSIRERVDFSRALLERLPKLKLLALVGRGSHMLDFNAATDLGIPVSTGISNSPVAPAELTLALIVASRRNVAIEAERMRQGKWPCTLSHRLRGSTLGIFGMAAAIAQLLQEGAAIREGGRVKVIYQDVKRQNTLVGARIAGVVGVLQPLQPSVQVIAELRRPAQRVPDLGGLPRRVIGRHCRRRVAVGVEGDGARDAGQAAKLGGVARLECRDRIHLLHVGQVHV
jgi:hypothetical protein